MCVSYRFSIFAIADRFSINLVWLLRRCNSLNCLPFSVLSASHNNTEDPRSCEVGATIGFRALMQILQRLQNNMVSYFATSSEDKNKFYRNVGTHKTKCTSHNRIASLIFICSAARLQPVDYLYAMLQGCSQWIIYKQDVEWRGTDCLVCCQAFPWTDWTKPRIASGVSVTRTLAVLNSNQILKSSLEPTRSIVRQ